MREELRRATQRLIGPPSPQDRPGHAVERADGGAIAGVAGDHDPDVATGVEERPAEAGAQGLEQAASEREPLLPSDQSERYRSRWQSIRRRGSIST